MSRRLNIERLRGAVDVLKTLVPENRLYSLKKMASNHGGSFDLPSTLVGADGKPVYQPTQIMIEVFHVRGTAHSVQDLAYAWLVAAEGLIDAADARTWEVT